MNHIKKSFQQINEIEKLAVREMVDKNYNGHFYTKWYNLYFSPLKNDPVNVLEIGILGAGSHRMWRDYFSNGKIFAIDINPQCFQWDLTGITAFLGDATDELFLNEVYKKIEGGIDIIIDDASHYTSDQIKTFNILFPQMNSGGIYIIEDLMTSYWKEYKTPPILSAVDYLKTLIDDINWNGKLIYQDFDKRINDQNLYKTAKEQKSTFSYMELNIESIHFYSGIAFIFKR